LLDLLLTGYLLVNQETSHRDAVHLLITADRRSLTAELADVHAEVEFVQRELQATRDKHSADLQHAEQKAAMVQLQAKQHGNRFWW